jgi:LemA protein
MVWVLVVVVAVVVLIALSIVLMYNALVRARHNYQNAYAQIDVQLSRRHDLIPNLVETVKAYMRHEQATLKAVVDARAAAVSAQSAAVRLPGDPHAMAALAGAENQLTGSLGQLFMIGENYPDLKADQNMRQLAEELTSAENRVAFARQAYNDAIMVYSNKRDTFPSNLVSNMFSFKPAAYLELDEPSKRAAPQISLDRNE